MQFQYCTDVCICRWNNAESIWAHISDNVRTQQRKAEQGEEEKEPLMHQFAYFHSLVNRLIEN